MRRFLGCLVLGTVLLGAQPSCAALGITAPAGSSAIIADIGSQAVNALIAYAEGQGWTKEQTRQAIQLADVAFDEAAGGSKAQVVDPSEAAVSRARAYLSGK